MILSLQITVNVSYHLFRKTIRLWLVFYSSGVGFLPLYPTIPVFELRLSNPSALFLFQVYSSFRPAPFSALSSSRMPVSLLSGTTYSVDRCHFGWLVLECCSTICWLHLSDIICPWPSLKSSEAFCASILSISIRTKEYTLSKKILLIRAIT